MSDAPAVSATDAAAPGSGGRAERRCTIMDWFGVAIKVLLAITVVLIAITWWKQRKG